MGLEPMIGMPLLERDDELAALRHALDGPGRGTGRLVVIEGSAGAGKSALLGAAVDLADELGLSVLRARGGELEREHSFGLARQLLEPAFRRRDAAAQAQLLEGAAHPAGRLLGLEGGPGTLADGFTMGHAVFWLLAGLAADQPLLLAVDDAHWGDASSLRALDHVARRIDDLPVALLVTFRPAEPGAPAALLDALRSTPRAVRLDPAPLGVRAATEVVRARWPRATEPACGAAHNVTAGSPLLLAELLRALPADQPPSVEAIATASIATLEERVLRRARRVAPEAARLAQAMAVLGDGARLATAATLAELDPATASELAQGLRRLEVLATEDPLTFVHPLVLRSLYDGLAAPERHALHARAAELLAAAGADAEVCAAHLAVLPPAGSVAVASQQLRAAESALGRAAPEEAISWLQRGLAEAAPQPPRAVLLARLGLARTALRDPAAVPLLREAYAGLHDPDLRRTVAIELAYSLGVAGAWEQAASVIDQAERDLDDDPSARADLAAVRATMERHDARRVRAFAARRAELELLAASDGPGANAVAAVLATTAVSEGDIDTARRQLALARRGERLLRDPGANGWAVPLLLMVPVYLDDLDVARTLIEQAEQAAQASGSALQSLTAFASGAWLRARRGDLLGAESDLNTLLELSRESDMAMFTANLALWLIDVLIERDSATAARNTINQMAVPAEFLSTWAGSMQLEARGRLRLTRGAIDEAITDLRAAGSTADALGIGPLASSWRSSLALAVASHDHREALTLASTELRLARATGRPRPQGVALRALGQLGARSDDAIALLRESVATLAGGPSRLEHARSLVALGAALRRTGRRREARAALGPGLELAVVCGADRLRAEAEEELLAAGGRRRPERHGIEALTASEMRVARLAASGRTNLEIAQRLFVSVKTVETHLAHAYGKLDLAGPGSRWRLASLLEDQIPPEDRSVV